MKKKRKKKVTLRKCHAWKREKEKGHTRYATNTQDFYKRGRGIRSPENPFCGGREPKNNKGLLSL